MGHHLSMTEPTRRAVLCGFASVGAALTLGSCTNNNRPSGSIGNDASPPPGASPTTTGLPSAPLPSTAPWVIRQAEVTPQAKLRAVRLVEATMAWPAGQAGQEAARRRVDRLGEDPALVGDFGSLIGDETATAVQVVDAQYGGIQPNAASVLVVLNRWTVDESGRVRRGGTTLDVRLSKQPTWRVTAVRPARILPAATHLTSTGRSALNNARIRLPLAARADVRSGGIADEVLTALLALSDRFVIEVSVLKSGHPLNVFGTDRQSDHTSGHAVDVWAVDGVPVLQARGEPLIARFMSAALDVGPWQVGGPVDVDSGGPVVFSDLTHQDHVHLGFR